jgi:hypothetical protein
MLGIIMCVYVFVGSMLHTGALLALVWNPHILVMMCVIMYARAYVECREGREPEAAKQSWQGQ